ncbi:DUF7927 domain-containing protein [Microbacterium plantarum]|uniref:DUF7927 domain-containing protein n=1 Tax=Microbacterium plantarum TaxID=1816425 RepID=A0ABV5ETZ3_9MICO
MTVVTALLGALLVVTGGVFGASSALAAPGDPLTCGPGVVYGVDGVAGDPNSGVIRQIDTTTGATTIVGSFGSPGAFQLNALGIVPGGASAYALRGTATAGQYTLLQYTSATNSVRTITTVSSTHSFVAGAIDPTTGYFWYGGTFLSDANRWGFSAINLATGADLGLQFTTPSNGGSNGDLAFDSSGNLYAALTAGSGTASQNRLLRFDRPLATGGVSVPGTLLTNLSPSTQAFNGVAFAADGFLYAQTGGGGGGARTIYRINPATGAVVSSVAVTNGTLGTDLASCASPSTLEVRKNIESRFAPGDQFALSIGGVSGANNTGVTSGSTLGEQNGEAATAGPVLVVPGATYSFAEQGSGGANLSNYASRYVCVDQNRGTTVSQGSTTSGAVAIPRTGAEGARVLCTISNRALEPNLSIAKTSNATENSRPGDTVTYTVTATNTGQAAYTTQNPAVVFDDLSGVLDDATYNNNGSANRPGSVSYASPLLSWSGALGVGQSVVVTYTVTLKAGGDGTVRNVAWEPNDPGNRTPPACNPPVNGTDPSTGEPCAENEYLLPKLTIEKTANRTELPAVGEVVEYTITVTNQGPGAYTATAPATLTDDLSNVLDAATYNDDAAASTGSVTYGEPTLSWQGALAANQSATITYSVTYTGQGDRNLRNLACVPSDETAPGAASCDFVQIPGAGLTQWKQVQASATPAVAGTLLTYTLYFRNDGEAAADVNAVDDLTHVTDDADVTTEPTSSSGLTAARDGNRISITGSVPSGQTSTVTYQVTVKPDGQRGDDTASNFLLPPGAQPPATPECVPTDEQLPNCTTTPIAAVTYAKSVSASSDPVEAGTVLTYTVTVESTGTATSAVSREDVLTDVLDDADLTSGPVSDTDSVVVSSITDGRFQITGELAAGETAVITYRVTVKADADRGNNLANNFLVPPGQEPPAECVAGDPACTSTPIPLIEATKSSDPASGSTVVAGQQVTYTLTFTNRGAAAGPVDYTDNLADVLDDTTLTTAPAASDDALEADLTGTSLRINGSLDAGQTVTVSYTVTVNADGARENNRLGNVLAPSDVPNPDCDDLGVSCTEHLIPQLDSWKSVAADATPVSAGTVLTYTLFFENTGQAAAAVDQVDDLTHVTDDADVTTEPASAQGLTVTRDGVRISITGSVPAGETYTVTYQVTVKPDGQRGDDIAANFLLNPGEQPPTAPVCQPADTERPDCTVTPIGRLLTSKSVSADTDPVGTGTVLTYTLTFDNQGQGPIEVDRTDILTDVLDDADLTTAPVASDDALTVSDVADDRFTVTGELAAGQTVTVTYQVTVKAEADRGNNTADNFLVPTGEEPPPVCADDNPNCTVTPLPLVEVVKSANPESGSGVQAGQQVTYTLTFTNVGEAVGSVDYTDNLAAVLDDADLTGAPASSDPVLVPSSGEDGTVRVTGTLAPGQTVTVSYIVTVKPDGERGDNQLRNVVAKTGTPDPQCGDTGVSCTEHPVGQLEDWKTVDPASGTTVQEGRQLTYTLHFENTGKAPVDVNREDNLVQVLDDADVTGQPVASSDALTVTDIADGKFQITGTLQPGQSETVTYTVTVKADGARGDDRLGNFLVNPGEEPPAECVPANDERADCTVNHVNDVVVVKSSDPRSGSEVNPGDEVTYTLTFRNTSADPDAAPAAVDYTDYMADVLDDATLTSGPATSNEDLQAVTEGDTIRITGAVPTGETYTVTYTVKVKDRADQGNHHLGNVVAITGEEPVCAPDSPLCTQHDVPPAPPVQTPPNLAVTGGQISAMVIITALALLAAGGVLVVTRRRRKTAVTTDGQDVGSDDLV